MKYLVLFLVLFLNVDLNSQDLDLYEQKIFVTENDTLNYRILKPLNYDSSKKYPVHLFLHGAGERGNDNESQLIHGSNLFLKENCEKFYDDNVELYKRVRNKDSIIKDFRTAVCKSWAKNGLDMEFTDETKLQIPELSKEEIKDWIDKLNLKKSSTEVKDNKKIIFFNFNIRIR